LDGKSAAIVWKNDGVLYNLTDGSQFAKAYSVTVPGGDVYVAGHVNNIAKVWKNVRVLYTFNTAGTAWLTFPR